MREWLTEEKEHRLDAARQEAQQQQQDQKLDALQTEGTEDMRSNASVANRQRYDHITPFEFNAYEALLTTVKALETQEFNKLQSSVNDTLSYFKSGKYLSHVLMRWNTF